MFSHMPLPIVMVLGLLDISCHTHDAVLHLIILAELREGMYRGFLLR